MCCSGGSVHILRLSTIKYHIFGIQKNVLPCSVSLLQPALLSSHQKDIPEEECHHLCLSALLLSFRCLHLCMCTCACLQMYHWLNTLFHSATCVMWLQDLPWRPDGLAVPSFSQISSKQIGAQRSRVLPCQLDLL